jgi:F-type H+-transporting ATPase subunit delta
MNKFSGALARRYGTALFEILVGSSKNQEDFEKRVQQIRTIKSCMKKEIINNFLLASLSSTEKIQVLEFFLEKVLTDGPVFPEIASFFKVVLLNKRLLEIKAILYFFLIKADEHLGIARAKFISARPLQEQDAKDFESCLKQVLNKKIVIKTELDESLRSGYIVQLGHTNIDASFKARLNSLKELFI